MDIGLIPGLWLDGSSWNAVIPVLERAGHSCHPITLPGLDGVQDPGSVSLADCVAAVTDVIDAVDGPDNGGIATFSGVVRRRNLGRDVDYLEYEAYEQMAAKTMRTIIEGIESEIPECRIAVEHRVGRLAIGDVAVTIAAAAPHRAEAFDACRAMIDRLKQSVPIWKKEVGPDGSEWIGLGP